MVTCRHQRRAASTSARHTAPHAFHPPGHPHPHSLAFSLSSSHHSPFPNCTPFLSLSLARSLARLARRCLPCRPTPHLRNTPHRQFHNRTSLPTYTPILTHRIMARAVAWRPCSRLAWAGDVSCSRQDFFSGKRGDDLGVRRPPVRNPGAALRSSSSSDASSTGFQARCASFNQSSSAWNRSMNNGDTNAQRWIEESVHEIVRNIQEAPFLQYVSFCNDSLGRSQRQKISQELLRNGDHWSPLSESLSDVDPDVVILVQKLDPNADPSESSCSLDGAFQSANNGGEEDEDRVWPPLQTEGAETNMWGVLVQARGVQVNACYLLTTSRVLSSAGICTRYCLTRAKCCGPSYVDQLENAWLL